MRLIECYIENFGKISKQKFVFSEGLNCFLSDNGTGKTTLSVFIKAMLYGLGDTKRTSIAENERKHYLPWQGGVCGGWITFSVSGKEYRAERSFAQKAGDDSFSLYELKSGLVSNDFSERLGEEIFGIDADGFERTVFLSERSLPVKSDNKSISAKLSDLVGADGDIGVMDGAIKILEDQRKQLYKKGGSGRIADIKAKISDTELKLSETELAKKNRDDLEREISAYEESLADADAEHKKLLEARTNAQMLSAEKKHAQRYKDIQAELSASVARKDELTEFFGGEIPTFEQLEEARYKSLQAVGLMTAEEHSPEEDELAGLSSYFEGRADESYIEKARTVFDRLKQKEESQKTPSALRARDVFSKRLPERHEIDGMINDAGLPQKQFKPGALIYIPAAAAVFSIIPAVLLSPLFYILTALLSLFAGIFAAARFAKAAKDRGEREERTNEFFRSVSCIEPKREERLSLLIEMKSLYEVAAEMLESYEEDERFADEFISAFPSNGQTEKLAILESILCKYNKYITLSRSLQYKTAGRREANIKGERLRRESLEFLSRFKTSSADPFAEIRQALNEYTRLTESIISKRSELESYEALNSTYTEGSQEAMPLDEINRLLNLTEARQNELRHKIGIQTKSIADENVLLDRKEELLLRRDELREQLKVEKERLDIILQTERYLDMAKVSLTSKYLGKTKAGFERYAELIGGISSSELEMDTDFGVSRREGGITRAYDAYSRGTRELYSIAARLALSDSLYEGERPFIILDDPFISFDDKKTSAAASLLRAIAKERQIIYFTCSESRRV